MNGNSRLPGVSVSEGYRVTNGSIWQGSPEATWFKAVSVNGTEGEAIKAGTIMKCLIEDGSYTPITEADIVSAVADLPGSRLAIVADKTAKSGTTTTTGEGDDAVTEATPSSVLVGVSGVVNKELLYVGEKRFTELEQAQQIGLNLQLEAWNFLLVNVIQA
ncbi:MAG: hypothetical protein IJG36_00985 [Synergistaceae bacterium]|nr:hypothetical protein [Synergistaceae bacterium]MBQ6002130.1 hypothetical protein [Synergistaceae bacterium]MBR0248662.1 hypothetical protein [Synergistaceae bacterium]